MQSMSFFLTKQVEDRKISIDRTVMNNNVDISFWFFMACYGTPSNASLQLSWLSDCWPQHKGSRIFH